jgi:hypothetical protein
MDSPNMSFYYFYFLLRVSEGGTRWPLIEPYDYEIRFTATGGKALVPAALGLAADRLIDVPFELWNIGIGTPDDPSDDYRMFPNILDVDGDNKWNLLTRTGVDSVDHGGGGATHSISDGANDPFTDWIYWVQPANRSPGQAGYNAIVTGAEAAIGGGQDAYLGAGTAGTDVMRRMVLVGLDFGSIVSGTYPQSYPEAGTTFRIVTNKACGPGDVFSANVPPAKQSRELALVDVNRINVFPNPYLNGVSTTAGGTGPGVVFSHLPRRVTVRIFTLAGTLARMFMKDDPSQFVRWDLRNERGAFVAPGVYIAYIEIPELGVTKILKVSVWAGL